MTQAQEIPESPGDPSSQPDTLGSVLGRLGPAAILGGVWTVLPALGGFALLAMVGPVSDWLNSHQEYGPFVYAAAFIIAAGIGVLPTYSQAVVGGWAFGPVIGTIAALAGFVGASLVGGGNRAPGWDASAWKTSWPATRGGAPSAINFSPAAACARSGSSRSCACRRTARSA